MPTVSHTYIHTYICSDKPEKNIQAKKNQRIKCQKNIKKIYTHRTKIMIMMMMMEKSLHKWLSSVCVWTPLKHHNQNDQLLDRSTN